MLQAALERNDLQSANSIINTINKMLGIGGKQVQIDNKDTTITVTFGD